MQPSAEISLIVFTLLVQMAVGIPLVALFAGRGQKAAGTRPILLKQCLYALFFVGVAGFLCLIHPRLPLHAGLEIMQPQNSMLGREIALLFVTGLSLAGAWWLSRPPSHTILVEALLATAALAGIALIYVMSKAYDKPGMDSLEACATFFLFLASALILGSFWLGCALCMKMRNDLSHTHRAMWTLFFFALAGFALLAAFAPISVPQPGPNVEMATEIARSIAVSQGLHTCLGGIGILFFCVALWKCQHEKAAGLWMLTALVLGICGEIAGRSAFFLGHACLGLG